MLALIDTTLEDIQRELAETLPGDAILVGHSIGNDLEAMKVGDFVFFFKKLVNYRLIFTI